MITWTLLYKIFCITEIGSGKRIAIGINKTYGFNVYIKYIKVYRKYTCTFFQPTFSNTDISIKGQQGETNIDRDDCREDTAVVGVLRLVAQEKKNLIN